jgi:ABC-type proline/glycine betaine transport system substrate-binding protein
MKRSIWFKLLLTAIFCLSLAATVFAEPSKQITLDEFEIGGIGVGTSLDTVVMKYGLPTKQSSFNYNRLIKGMIYKYGDLLTVEAIPKSDGGTSVIGVVCKNPKLFTPSGFAVGPQL